jgi:hypothetical protein
MFEHNGKLILFDDCDSALGKNTETPNLLKGALDSDGSGVISYGSAGKVQSKHPLARDRDGNTRGSNSVESDGDDEGDGKSKYYMPTRFGFKGRMIFISNLSRDQMPAPIVDSRALSIDLSMTPTETIERLRKIKDKMPIQDANGDLIANVTQEDRDAAVDFMDKYHKSMRLSQINARTMGSIIKIKKKAEAQGKDWEKTALITIG